MLSSFWHDDYWASNIWRDYDMEESSVGADGDVQDSGDDGQDSDRAKAR